MPSLNVTTAIFTMVTSHLESLAFNAHTSGLATSSPDISWIWESWDREVWPALPLRRVCATSTLWHPESLHICRLHLSLGFRSLLWAPSPGRVFADSFPSSPKAQIPPTTPSSMRLGTFHRGPMNSSSYFLGRQGLSTASPAQVSGHRPGRTF